MAHPIPTATVHSTHYSIMCVVVAAGKPLSRTAAPKLAHQGKCTVVIKLTI